MIISKKGYIELPPIKETISDYDQIEKHLKELFRRTIYLPLLKELGESWNTIHNAKNELELLQKALQSGKITFSHGVFSGKFNASLSKLLKKLGAKWDKKNGEFRSHEASLPPNVRVVISSSEQKFSEKMGKLDKKLSQILPEEIAGQVKLTEMFDRTLWKTNKDLEKSVKNIAIPPKLTPESRKKIAKEWQNNMEKYIKDFSEDQIKELRQNLQKTVFSGNRYESVVKTIQKSYGVSANKAKFLARQETSLLMSKFKESRYADAGVHEYTWHSVAGSPAHPVRPRHKALAEASKSGKIYRWDDPPVTSEPGEPIRKNNPGEDFNCRCFAKPVVRFRAKEK